MMNKYFNYGGVVSRGEEHLMYPWSTFNSSSMLKLIRHKINIHIRWRCSKVIKGFATTFLFNAYLKISFEEIIKNLSHVFQSVETLLNYFLFPKSFVKILLSLLANYHRALNLVYIERDSISSDQTFVIF